MKFKKFFKETGVYGLIVKNSESESWLLCGGAGMPIPKGVNALGVNISPEPLFKAIVNSVSDDDNLELKEAILRDPDGKAKDIIRVFETDYGDRIGITNSDFGYLEKTDVLTYLEVEADDPKNEGVTVTVKLMVVRDLHGDAIGFITGVESI